MILLQARFLGQSQVFGIVLEGDSSSYSSQNKFF